MDKNVESEFEFVNEVLFNGEMWKLYRRFELKNVIILDPETLNPYKTVNPVVVEIRIIVCGDRIRQYPEVVANNQSCMCQSLEDENDKKIIDLF